MPAKKQPDKKHKKLFKLPAKEKESAIESLPQPAKNPERAPNDIKLVLNQTDTPQPPASPTEAQPIQTPITPTPVPAPTTEIPAAVPLDPLTPLGQAQDDFEPEKGGHLFRVLLIFITALLAGGVAVAGFLYVSQKKPQKVPAPHELPTPAVTIMPTEPVASSSATGTVDVSSLSVQILNGSGIAGEASRVRDDLKKVGFTNFSLGNADSYDFTDTQVQVKENADAGLFKTIQEALSNYTTVEKDPLLKTNTYDVVITVGKQK